MPDRLIARLALVAGLVSALALIAHFAILPPLPSAASTVDVMTFASHRQVLLLSAWLDGLGSLLLVATAIAIAQIAGAADTMAGRVVQFAAAAIAAMSLVSDALLVAVAGAGAHGDAAGASAAYLMLSSADYVFPFANTFWVLALAVIVLRTRALPVAFGYAAALFGTIELVGGLAALYSDAVNAVVGPGFLALLAWLIAAAAVLAFGRHRDVEPRTSRVPA